MKVSRNFPRSLVAAVIVAGGALASLPVHAENATQSSGVTSQNLQSDQKPGRDWIEKMSSAMQNLNYTGTFVYIHDSEVETMRIFHSKLDGVEHERLISLNGEAREIIRNADSVVCIWPGSKSVIVSKSQPRTPFPQFDPEQLSKLELIYDLRKSGYARVAGRHTKVIDIAPLDNYRYGYRLWLDAKTFLLLRSAMSDSNGNVVEQVMFTDVSYPDQMPLEVFNASITGREHKWLQDAPMTVPTSPEVDVDIPGIDELALPSGFELVSDKITPVAGTEFVVRRIMYSDGLASLSVFVADAEDKSSGGILHGASSMGAVHAYGVQHNKWHATVVGEVPHATVKMLAESLLISSR